MVNINFNENVEGKRKQKRLIVSGHAGYAEKGKDIVCAGISSIVSALHGYIENYPDCVSYSSFSDEDGGFMDITAEFPAKAESAVKAAFDMALIGLLQIEMSYPNNVTVSHKK